MWQLVGRADEAVVADVERSQSARNSRGDLVAVLLLGDALLARDALDVLAVLVGAGEQEGVVARRRRARVSASAAIVV